MNFWDWAHQHPIALVICVFLISAAIIHIADSLARRAP
jgi:hypothetical protein